MNKLLITRVILSPMPHRRRQSMVAVIIVFINRCHSIHEVVGKSKYYLFPTFFFWFGLFLCVGWLLFFISFVSIFCRCFTLYFVFVIRFWFLFFSLLVRCTLLILCMFFFFILLLLFLGFRYCLQYYDSSVTDLWKTLSIIKLFSFRFCSIWFLVDYQQIHQPFERAKHEWTKKTLNPIFKRK